ncbi:MAG: hypothetical protein D3908_01135 [Candidatus Electrothrix sp. AUS4]|nr:hypothetical protein [Candidatus Electrothrix sp. AUS4]
MKSGEVGKMDKKEINISREEGKKTKRKKVYEKPKMETVMLFADQVLGACKLSPPCVIPDPLMS